LLCSIVAWAKIKGLRKIAKNRFPFSFLFVLCRAVFICVFPGFCLVRLPLSRAVYATALAQTRLLLGILHSNRFYNWHFDDLFLFMLCLALIFVRLRKNRKWNGIAVGIWVGCISLLGWIALDWIGWVGQ